MAAAEAAMMVEEPQLRYQIVMDVVGIERRESREAAAELQYPRATVPARVLFTN
jgi:hypothetical protein